MTHQRRLKAARITAAVVLALAVGSRVWGAEPGAPPNYGHTFATITHPGNAPWVGLQAGTPLPISWGDVNYSYRLAKTEVTNAQWLDFVRAAAPFVDPNAQNSSTFTGPNIVRIGGSYVMASQAAQWGVTVGWRYVARYCNWLHNGAKPAGEAAAADFATGAYDISTFGSIPHPTIPGVTIITDQATRSPGAKYWIPSLDEWTKAVYWDPNRNGPDQPGYWLYPGGQDTQPITQSPSNGGQTSAGALFLGVPYAANVGSYPNFGGPWGILDASGSVWEWLEDLSSLGGGRYYVPSDFTATPVTRLDRINNKEVHDPTSGHGIRIASAVPSPGPGLMVGGFAAVVYARRRRRAVSGAARQRRGALGGACALALSAAGNAQGPANGPGAPPDYGFNFATITHAGNAPTQTFPRPGFPTLTVGAVSHEYRISTTETTNAQWFEFVRAYAPFVNANSWTSEAFIGRDIFFQGVSGGAPQYFLPPSRAQRPSEIGWAFAARFCNWSHNGQKGVGEAAAADFEAGAYDMSRYLTPGWDSAHTPGAKYWIPTMDEWVKAAYWDPNKNGPGQPGYWAYPITSDAAPIAGEPGSGGQTNTGAFPAGQVRPLDVGSYPTVMSPWGLLDASGGLEEWVQNPYLDPLSHQIVGSTLYSEGSPTATDLLVRTYGNTDGSLRIGFRIASAVPGSTAAPALLALAALSRRSRAIPRRGR